MIYQKCNQYKCVFLEFRVRQKNQSVWLIGKLTHQLDFVFFLTKKKKNIHDELNDKKKERMIYTYDWCKGTKTGSFI